MKKNQASEQQVKVQVKKKRKRKRKPKDPTRKSANLGVNRTGLMNKAVEIGITRTFHGYILRAIDEQLKRDKIK